MKYTTTIYFNYLICFVFCLFLGNLDVLQAQGVIQTKVKSKVRRTVYKEINTLKASAKLRVKGSKRALKQSLKGRKGNGDPNTDPTLDELIDDAEVKASLYDNKNKKRYVELLGEWTTMPSDAELLARAKLKAIQDSLNNIDRKLLRVTKNVWDDSRPMIIFGWHPHWAGEIYRGYDYGLFNVVSYYSYDINPDNGSPQNSAAMAGFLESDFVSNAHDQGCSALLSVTCHGEQNVMRFLSQNVPAQQRFMDSILYILDSTNADGIEINFEGVNSSVKDDFFKFVRILSTTVTGARGDTSFVFLSVPAYDPENIYDIGKLQNFVDIFVVKGFDFQETPNGLKKMPTAPLNSSPLSSMVDLRTTVDKYIANLGPLYSDRLILSLPYFGTRWFTDGITEEILNMDAITFSDIQFDFVMEQDNFLKYPEAEDYYDATQNCRVFKYKDYYGIDTSLGQVPVDVTLYYDDTTSLRTKYRYLIDSRLGGVGVQFLGNDSGFERLENLLSNEFMEMVVPYHEDLEKLKEKNNEFRQNSIYVLVVLFYLSIFMAIGFCVALFKRSVRQALFDNGKFRLAYMIFFTFLLLLLGGYMGLFKGATFLLLVGVGFGAVVSWGGWKYFTRKKTLTP